MKSCSPRTCVVSLCSLSVLHPIPGLSHYTPVTVPQAYDQVDFFKNFNLIRAPKCKKGCNSDMPTKIHKVLYLNEKILNKKQRKYCKVAKIQ